MPCLHVIFKHSIESSIEGLVQLCSGKMIHVDIVPNQERSMYTCYMFESFSENDLDDCYRDDTHTRLRIEVSELEYQSVVAMLKRLVEKKVPYNTSDIIWLFMGSGSCKDIEKEESIESLFCSQAITLVLRMCLTENKQLIETLHSLNSRKTTPNILYNAIQPHAQVEEFGI